MADEDDDFACDLAREARIFGEPLMADPRTSDTHFTHPDEPVSRNGATTAVCGARVNEHFGEVDLQAPTCAKCRAWLAERNAPRIGEHGEYVN